MAETTAEQKRALLPFLQRAEEIQKADPRVAYYCRMYAVEEGLKLPVRSKEVDTLLASIMDKLERDKARLGELNAEDDKLSLEGFALKIFARAAKVDNAGAADLNTCKAFYAASVFLEILRQFGEIDEDLSSKQRYAAWKAADIRKAIREGRKPTPGPSASEETAEKEDLPTPPSPASQHGLAGVTPTATAGPSAPSIPSMPSSHPPAQAPPPMPATVPYVAPAAAPSPARTSGVSTKAMLDAQKQAKFAVSALGFEDCKSAIAYLEKALVLLKHDAT